MSKKYKVEPSTKFRRDYKRAIKRGYDMRLLDDVVDMLSNGNQLPEKYLDHSLKGDWGGFRECHITSDWLLVYRYEDDVLILVLQRTGTHSDLF
ncbi:MAG: type II toxin-antitoxin system YafQ family toxin [Defluviitaleaceae bacterium]|nr:type II toxin-antitoxin system YafQ family toxin [Defluviitaleaceae bacterium]